MKLHLRVDTTDEDDYIDGLIKQAASEIREHTNRMHVVATVQARWDGFPEYFILPAGPVVAVNSITYTDTAGNTGQTVSSGLYKVLTSREPGEVRLADSEVWPSSLGDADNVVVEYTAGYADVASVDDRVKRAIMLLVGTWYENRESVVTGTIATALPHALERLLRSLRIESPVPPGE